LVAGLEVLERSKEKMAKEYDRVRVDLALWTVEHKAACLILTIF
jgi:hypothetical protein